MDRKLKTLCLVLGLVFLGGLSACSENDFEPATEVIAVDGDRASPSWRMPREEQAPPSEEKLSLPEVASIEDVGYRRTRSEIQPASNYLQNSDELDNEASPQGVP